GDAGHKKHNEQRRENSPRPPLVKSREREGVRRVVAQKNAGDQESADDEEDGDDQEAAAKPLHPGMEQYDPQHRDRAQSIDVTARNGLALVPAVQRLGAEVVFADPLMLRLKVNLETLEPIAELPGVVFVQPPVLPRTQSVVRSAPGIQQPHAVADVTSEGDV